MEVRTMLNLAYFRRKMFWLAVDVLCALISMSMSAQAATATFGHRSTGPIKDTGDANYINAWKFRTASTQFGTIVSMSVYVSGPVSAAPNNQLQVAIYSDAGGVPGSLIVSSASRTISPNAWNTAALSGSLLPNTSYWLAYNTNSIQVSDNNVPVGATGSGQQVWRARTFGSWPSTFGAVQGSSSNIGSIYITYSPGAGVSDTTPPTVPANLQASAASATQINLSWNGSTDNVAITGYKLERCQGSSCTNFAQVATPTATSFNDTNLMANTTYRYRVRATDAAGNLSNYSSIANATTLNTPSQTSGSACNAPPLQLTGTSIVNVSTESQLQSAVANAQTGDTVVLADGTYYLTSTLYLNGKNNVTIRGNSGCDGVILIGKGMDNASYGNVLFGIWSNALNTTIAHLTIRDTYDNTIVFNAGAQAPHVYSVKLLNAGSQFIKSNPTDPANGIGVDNGVIEYSWMEYTAGPPATDHGAGIGYTNGLSAHAADNWIIRNNLFKNFHTPDSSAYPWNPAVLVWNHSQNTITEKNIFINVDRAIAYGLVDQTTGTDHSGGTIRNNIVYLQPGLMSAARKAGSDGAMLVWDSPNTKVYHNTVLTNGNVVKAIEFRFVTTGGEARNNLADAPIGSRDGATFTQSGNYLSATQAMFVNPASADLHMLDTTATRANVIDHGVVLTAVTDDIDNATRPYGAGYDIGADEFGASSPAPVGSGTGPGTSPGATDTTAPSVPQGLLTTVVSSSQINLSWSVSTDKVGVTGYRVYRSGTQVGMTPSPSYAVTGLASATAYSFTVAAYDAAGNVSAQSNTAVANTLPLPAPTPAPTSAPAPGNLPLLQKSDLQYRGAFLLPSWTSDATSFSYGGTALAYNPTQHSLFIVGHDQYQRTAEVSIPLPVQSTTLSALPRATLLQPFTDVTEGKLPLINPPDPNAKKIGGHLVYNDHLYVSGYSYYDGAATQGVSHFVRPLSLTTTGQGRGPAQVGTLGAGFVSGYMTLIPLEWQSAFGGPALTGNCCLSIISRTSYGPAAFVFDPATVGGTTPVPDSPLVYYPSSHPTLGTWGDSWNPSGGVFWDGSTVIRGLVFPSGSRSVLFFGTQGVGGFCYGEGTSDPRLAGKPTPDGTIWCYDPDDPYKGTHGYPYTPMVWAYDANELLAGKQGQKQPWEVTPYATWPLTWPFGSATLGGAAYDAVTGTIYVSQQFGNGSDPVIHVFRAP